MRYGKNGLDAEEQGGSMPAVDDKTVEELAQLAVSKANAAANHALAAHQEIGRVAAAVARLEGNYSSLAQGQRELFEAMQEGFVKLAGHVREQQRSLSDLQEGLAETPDDNTQIRSVKALAKQATGELEAKVAALEAAKLAEDKANQVKLDTAKAAKEKWEKRFASLVATVTAGVAIALILRFVFHIH